MPLLNIIELVPLHDWQGIIVIIDQSELPSSDDVMVKSLEHALQYNFPIIVSLGIHTALERKKIDEDQDFERQYSTWKSMISGKLMLLYREEFLENKTKKSEEITEVELKIGLKVQHPNNVHRDSTKRFIEDFSAFFIQKGEIDTYNTQHDSRYAPKKWRFFITGHGMQEKSVVGLSLQDFGDLLSFLNTQLDTQILLYSTCYGGGCNRRTVYGNKPYNFTIVTLGASETVTFATRPNFEKFFNAVFDIKKLYTLLRTSGFLTNDQPNIYNVPQVRYPKSDKFLILSPDMKEYLIVSDETLPPDAMVEIPGITKILLLGEISKPISLKKTSTYPLPALVVNSLEQKKYVFHEIDLSKPSSFPSSLQDFLSSMYDENLLNSYIFSIKKLVVGDHEKNFYNVEIMINNKEIVMTADVHDSGAVRRKKYVLKDKKLQEQDVLPATLLDRLISSCGRFITSLYLKVLQF